MDFYARVKQIAKGKGTSLQDFIISLGLNQDSYYTRKRAGNLPRADEALLIAQALGTTVEYLVTGAEPESTGKQALDEIQAVIDRHRKT